MKFIPILMDLIPVDPVIEEEIIEEAPALSAGGFVVAGIAVVAVVLTVIAIRKNRK